MLFGFVLLAGGGDCASPLGLCFFLVSFGDDAPGPLRFRVGALLLDLLPAKEDLGPPLLVLRRETAGDVFISKG